jgi:hypothetical protein
MYKSAFYLAIEMIQRATVHLENTQEDSWVKSYDLSLDAWTIFSEVSVRLGKFEDAERDVKEVLDHALSLEDKFGLNWSWFIVKCLLIIVILQKVQNYWKILTRIWYQIPSETATRPTIRRNQLIEVKIGR